MSLRILIVEDSVSMRQMVSFTLKNAGYDVIEAEDGCDAIEKLNDGPQPDIVVTDLNMPNMDGVSLVRAIRQREEMKHSPILILTTESQDSKKKEGRDAGATGWIVKPFNPDQLLKVLKKVAPA